MPRFYSRRIARYALSKHGQASPKTIPGLSKISVRAFSLNPLLVLTRNDDGVLL